MKYLSVCAGIEAATCAWHHMGWEPVAFSEIEKFPSAVLAHHYPNVPNWGDMTKFQEWPDVCRCVSDRQHELPIQTNRAFDGNRPKERPSVHPEQKSSSCGSNNSASKGTICEQCGGTNIDVLVGGTPCQSFSVAGLRKGLDDPRGNLMLTFGAIAQRYRPEWLVWENVPGVLSSNGGRDFGAFLGMLAELGYGFAYRVLDAQYFGVPQRRRRVFVCAVRGTGNWQRAAAVLFERHSLSGHPAPSRQTRKGTAGGAAPSVDERGIQHTVGTLCADTHPGAYSGQDAYTGKLVPQPVAGTLGNRGLRSHTELDGHGAYIPVAIQGTLIGRSENAGPQGSGADVSGAMFTLTKTDVHAVAIQDVRAVEKAQNGKGWNDDGSAYTVDTHATQGVAVAFGVGEQPDIGHCLRSGASKADKHESTTYVAQAVGVTLHGTDGTTSVASYTDVSSSLRSRIPSGVENSTTTAVMQPMAVDFRHTDLTGDTAHTIQAKKTGGFSLNYQPGVMQAMQVRRLTPVECERLQGFPDGYTNIPWRGKPESPDGPRYKALGNSMAVPVMRWIGERINEVSKL